MNVISHLKERISHVLLSVINKLCFTAYNALLSQFKCALIAYDTNISSTKHYALMFQLINVLYKDKSEIHRQLDLLLIIQN